MTNTGMLAGASSREEMIASTKRGLYCANFGGGQVDITNGKFVFQCTEAYLIEDGKVTSPVKGATLIGDGPRRPPATPGSAMTSLSIPASAGGGKNEKRGPVGSASHH